MVKIIAIVEWCNVDYINEDKREAQEAQGEHYAKRVVLYQTSKKDLSLALIDYQENFNLDIMLEAHDHFDGGCLDSEVISIRFTDKAYTDKGRK